MNDAHEILLAIGRLEQGQQMIVDRLDRLNGSVARHEQALGAIYAWEAAHDSAAAAVDKSTSRLIDRLMPFVYSVLGGAVLFILAKGPEILKLIRW